MRYFENKQKLGAYRISSKGKTIKTYDEQKRTNSDGSGCLPLSSENSERKTQMGEGRGEKGSGTSCLKYGAEYILEQAGKKRVWEKSKLIEE